MAAESKDNEHVSEHKKARQSQGGGLETGLDQRIEGKEEEQVGLEPTSGERCRSTMSGLCNCLLSFWVCVFLPCVGVFWCCCSSFSEYFLGRFKPGFSDFTDGLVFLMKEPIAEEDNRYFVAKAATTSIFVPCVIGTGGNTFKLSAAISWLVRTLAVVFVGLLYIFYFPSSLHSRTTILFCGTNKTVASLPGQPGENETCMGWNCFQFCLWDGNCPITHKLRLCNEGDLPFVTSMGLILVLCQVLALVSILHLNALADYETLWKASKRHPSSVSPRSCIGY